MNKKSLIDGKEVKYDAWTASYTDWLEEEFKKVGRRYLGKGHIIWDDGKIDNKLRHFWQKSEQVRANER